MKIAIIGTGYVGLPTGVGLASFKNEVVCVDNDISKINALNSGKLTLYEDGLQELFVQTVREGNLTFSTSLKQSVENADLVILAVGTPPHPKTKEADLSFLYDAARQLSPFLRGYTVLATKSTVPVGTGDELEKLIKNTNPNAEVDVVSLPEFLREGYAVYDFFHPDRIVVGTNSLKAKALFEKLYAPFEGKTNMLFLRRRSAEAVKYASNAFLAMKIHYINEMADFCEKSGADIFEVSKGMGLDKRIGERFLNAGPGYGGSCFPKDTMAMALMAEKYEVNLSLVKCTIEGNKARKKQMAERILNAVRDVKNPRIGILGLAFKNGTDDVRQSPAMEIIAHLLKANVKMIVYDPKALANARKILHNRVEYAAQTSDVFKKTDVVAVLTEWPVFKQINLQKEGAKMRRKRLVDLRNLFDAQSALSNGFLYEKIG